MRPIGVTNLTKRPSPRVGPKSIAVPISFDPADTDANNTFRFDIAQEMQTGQFETPQALFFDNTNGAVDVQMLFSDTNQIVRFPTRSLSVLPFFGSGKGPVYVRYQTADWNNYPGFADVLYKPVLYFLNTPSPFGIWQKPGAFEGATVNRYGAGCTGGLASDMVLDAVVNGTTPETRVRLYIENPASETEPLYWNLNGTASGTRPRLMPGEHIIIGEGAPMSQGSIQVAATTAGHLYRILVWSLQ